MRLARKWTKGIVCVFSEADSKRSRRWSGPRRVRANREVDIRTSGESRLSNDQSEGSGVQMSIHTTPILRPRVHLLLVTEQKGNQIALNKGGMSA